MGARRRNRPRSEVEQSAEQAESASQTESTEAEAPLASKADPPKEAEATTETVWLANSRVFYTSQSKGVTLAERGEVVDPVSEDLESMLSAGTIDPTKG